MIDLHLHTTYSDGKNTLIELLTELEKQQIKTISITDHDTTLAYDEIESLDITKIYSGNIIMGMEITTSFNGNRIEILAYGFDNHKMVSDKIKEMNNIDWIPILISFRTNLLNRLDELNLKYGDEFKSKENMINLYKYDVKLYKSLADNNSDLKENLKEDYCSEDESFFRKCIANPKSKFYCNYYQFRPSIEKVVNLIHENGGLCFFAHPFGYNLEKPMNFAEELFKYCEQNNCRLDGIETYYFDFDKEKVSAIELFAEKYNLFKSGGSDCHGYQFDHIFKLGKYLNGDANIEEEWVADWVSNFKN